MLNIGISIEKTADRNPYTIGDETYFYYTEYCDDYYIETVGFE